MERQGAVAIACRLHRNPDETKHAIEQVDQALMVFAEADHTKALQLAVWTLDQDRMITLGNINRDPGAH